MKKIILVQTQAENAGAQEITRQLAAGFERRGFQTSQIFFFRRTKAFDGIDNVTFCRPQRPSNLIEIVKLLQELFRLIRTEKPDAIFTFQHYGNLLAAPIARLAGVPSIIANQVSAAQHISGPVKIADLFLGIFGFYDKIVVNSAVTELAYRYYPSRYRRRITRIDHGFFDKSLDLDQEAARLLLELPLKVKLFGCAARLHPLKQLDLAIRTLPLNRTYHFAIAGQGPQFFELQILAETLGVGARVHFLGELDTEGIGRFLAALDCFVFPSAGETFGLAPVEAAQAGVPVIANDLPVLRDVLMADGQACALFTDVRDTQTFASTIAKVLTDETISSGLSSAGKRLKNRFPLDRMIDAYCELVR